MSARIPDSWLDELRSRVNLVDVVSNYVALNQKGRRYWGLCPFHSEKTPSFSVDSEAQMYYCFGCHQGGNVIHFIMEIERMEFLEAVEHLAESVHMEMPERTFSQGHSESREIRQLIYEANAAAAHYFHNLIWTGEGSKALSYLYKRGLDDAAIRKFGLGASGQEWDGLLKHLKSKGFEDESLLIKAGLIGAKDGRSYDLFRNRVIFPIIDAHGKVLGFGGRASGDVQPKYLNTSDTPVFNKRQGLYALNFLKKERGLKNLTLVEGYMDVVALRQNGVRGVVATLGTALTEEQARLIKRYVPEVWISYDGDSAGQKAILRALEIFESQNVEARVLDIPDGMDPDDFIRNQGLEAFNALPRLKPPEYRMLRAQDELDMTTQEGRTQYAIASCNILKSVKNPVEVEAYLKKLAVQTGFAIEVLRAQMGVPQANSAPQPRLRKKEEQTAVPDHIKAENTLIALLAMGRIGSQIIQEDDFEQSLPKKIALLLLQGVAPAALLDKLEEDERALAVRMMQETPPMDDEKALTIAEDCINRIRQHRLEQKLEQSKQQLAQAAPDQRRSQIAFIQQLMQELELLKTGRKE